MSNSQIINIKKSVLVVDDEDSLRDLFEIALDDENRNTIICGSGKEALELMEETKFDLVLLDLRMPELSGIDVLRIMRERGNLTRVMLFSAYIPPKSLVKALSYGVTRFLNKPVTLDLLRKAVGNALEEHWHRDFAIALEEAEKLNFEEAARVAKAVEADSQGEKCRLSILWEAFFTALGQNRNPEELVPFVKDLAPVLTIR